MSLQTWKDEFYPIEATETLKENAVQHCLTKWQGLTPENLAKHQVILNKCAWVVDQGAADGVMNNYVNINGSTCALCHHYLRAGKGENPDYEMCETCPLCIARDGVACDKERDDEEEDQAAPWYEFRETFNPQSMIFWLKKTLKMQSN